MNTLLAVFLLLLSLPFLVELAWNVFQDRKAKPAAPPRPDPRLMESESMGGVWVSSHPNEPIRQDFRKSL